MRIDSILEFTKTAHEGQFRKGSDTPYIAHPLAVIKKLHALQITSTSPVEELTYRDYLFYAVALMHDLMEDTSVTFEQIKEISDIKVAECVECLTYRPGLASDNPFSKTYYLKRICDSYLPCVFPVKCVDRLCNVRDFMEVDNNYARKYFHKADILWCMVWEKQKLESEPYYKNLWEEVRKLNTQLGGSNDRKR